MSQPAGSAPSGSAPVAAPPRVKEVSSASQTPANSSAAAQPSAPSQVQGAGAVAAPGGTPGSVGEVASEDEMVATINPDGQPEVSPLSDVAGGNAAGANTATSGAPGAVGQVSQAAPVPSEPPPPDGSEVYDVPAPEGEEFDDQDASALQDFDPYLRDHGSWVEHPHYGTVWVPSRRVVGPKFVPYVTAGHWALTSNGDWMWVSDYPFGWVTFHYGRWIWTSDYNWVWIAGRTYAPAWVRFRTFGQPYIGWGPLPPTFIWRGGVAVGLGLAYPVPYVFCPYGYAFYSGVSSYIIWERYRVRELVRRSRPLPPPRHAGRDHRGPRVASPPVRDIPPQARPGRREAPSAYALALSRRASTAKVRTAPFRVNPPATYPRRGAGGANLSQRSPAQFNNRVVPNGSRPGAVRPRGNESRPNVGSRPSTAGARPGRTTLPRRFDSAAARRPPSPTLDRRRSLDAGRIEPRQSAPRRIEPRQSAPRRVEPRQSAPRRVEPRQSAPRRIEPRQSAPRRVEPRQSAPRRVEPRQSAPRRIEPRQSAPRRIEPRQSAPSRSVAPSRSQAPSRSMPSRSFSPSRSQAPRSSGGGRRR